MSLGASMSGDVEEMFWIDEVVFYDLGGAGIKAMMVRDIESEHHNKSLVTDFFEVLTEELGIPSAVFSNDYTTRNLGYGPDNLLYPRWEVSIPVSRELVESYLEAWAEEEFESLREERLSKRLRSPRAVRAAR